MRVLALMVSLAAMAMPALVPQRAESRAAEGATIDTRVEVVGGVWAGRDEFPWVVRLNNGCAGTLVRTQYVLTAAHCVGRTGRNTSIVVTAGSSDLSSAASFGVRSAQVQRAAGFSHVTLGKDWAVIRLAKPVDLPVVSLPGGSGLDNGMFTAIGWGATSEGSHSLQRYLRKVQVPQVSDATCGRLYRSGGHNFVPSDMLCAGDTARGGKDSCQGDSGGPLLRRDGKRWVQVGIVSWGVGCGRAKYPGVYTQVSRFVPDIRTAIEE
jgi:secreted trypsin-like serine protease